MVCLGMGFGEVGEVLAGAAGEVGVVGDMGDVVGASFETAVFKCRAFSFRSW